MGNGRKTTDNCVGLRRSVLRLYSLWMELISSENISCIYLVFYIIQTGIVTVGYNGMRHMLKCIQVIDYPASKEGSTILQGRFINNDLSPFRLDPFHHPLNRALTEIIGITLHRQPIDSYDDLLFFRCIPTAVGFVVTG